MPENFIRNLSEIFWSEIFLSEIFWCNYTSISSRASDPLGHSRTHFRITRSFTPAFLCNSNNSGALQDNASIASVNESLNSFNSSGFRDLPIRVGV